MGDLIGHTIREHYRLKRVIGSGGFGVVYEGEDIRLGRRVAVKHLRQEQMTGTLIKRFQREARILGSLKNTHVVTLLDLAQEPTGLFIIMEYADGGSLQELLARPSFSAGLPLPDVLAVARSLTSALITAHRHRIIHRDIKPANVLLCDAGESQMLAKLADFGVAHQEAEGTPLTPIGMQPGTLPFLSPEQVQGKPLTPASDIYSLGILFYRLLTNRHYLPHSPDRLDTLRRICEEQPIPVRQLRADTPEWLSKLVMQMLDKNPARRPAATTLYKILRTEGKAESERFATPPVVKNPGRRAGVKAQVIFLVLLLFGGWTIQGHLVPIVELFRQIANPNLEGWDALIVSNEGAVNLRNRPSITGEVIEELEPGSVITLLARDESASWCFVETATHQGWVNARYIPTSAAGYLPVKNELMNIPAVVAHLEMGEELRLRDAPTLEGNILTTLSSGTFVTILGYSTDQRWAQIQVNSEAGVQGWVSTAYLEEDDKPRFNSEDFEE